MCFKTLFTFLSCLIILCPAASFSADNIDLIPREKDEFAKMSVDKAIEFTLLFKEINPEKYIRCFKLFYDRALSRSEALKFLEKIPPFTRPEADKLADIVADENNSETGNIILSELGHQLAAFGDKKGPCIKLIFLTEKEKAILKNSIKMVKLTKRPPADFFSSTLEAKLCVIASEDTECVFVYPRVPRVENKVKNAMGRITKTDEIALFDLERFADSIRLYNTFEGKNLNSLEELAEKYVPDIMEFPDPWNRLYKFDAKAVVIYSTGPNGTSGSEKNTLAVKINPNGETASDIKTGASETAEIALEKLADRIKMFIKTKNRLPRTLLAYEREYNISTNERIDPWGRFYLMSSDEVILYSLGPDGRSPRLGTGHPAETKADDIAVSLKR